MGTKMRKSNYELLRIISMLLILMSHSDEIFGLSKMYSTSIGINKLITDFLHIGGQVGVGCFVLITGYFMIDKTITLKRILKLTGEVWFYTITIWLGWFIIKMLQGGIGFKVFGKQTLFAFFPIILRHYWFVTAFVILMILSPFLNKLIHTLDYSAYSRFLIILIVVFVVLIGGFPKILPEMVGGRLVPMIIVYFIAGYIKRFRIERKNNARKHLMVAVLGYIILFASAFLITLVGLKMNNAFLLDNRYFYRVLNSPIVIIICVELFIGFTELKIRDSRIINTIASCTFGVFLIHANKIIMPALGKLFPVYKEKSPLLIFVYSMLAVFAMYIVFTLIDYLRQITVEKVWICFLDNHLEVMKDKAMMLIKKIANRVKKIGRAYYK
ncbi:MAG: acyltransferase [Eubacterium sp.]|nr:acyltransferase [Eubacterium sp.]